MNFRHCSDIRVSTGPFLSFPFQFHNCYEYYFENYYRSSLFELRTVLRCSYVEKKIMKNYFFRNRVRSDARKSSLCNRGHFGKILLHPPSIIVLQQIKSADIIRFIDAEMKR